MMSQTTGKLIITIHILPSILRSKGHQVLNIDPLIEYNIFLKDHAQHRVENLVPNTCKKSKNWAYLWINILQFYTICLNCISKSRGSSVKWSDPAHFLKSQGKFIFSFPCTLFYILLTPKNYRWDPKKYTGSLHFTLLSFLQYLNNYLGQLILSLYTCLGMPKWKF